MIRRDAPVPPVPPAPKLRGKPMADMRIHQVVEWTPRWSAHKFVLLGSEDWAVRTAHNYDGGRNEAVTSDLVLAAEFDLLVDIGAAYGYYPCLLKSHRPDIPVVAIEADPTRYGCLLRNVAPYPDVKAVYGMAGDYDLRLDDVDKMCDVRTTATPRVDRRYSLRELWDMRGLAVRPLFKIDTEGGEGDILRSGLDVVRDTRTRWIVEHHSWGNMSLTELMDLFRTCGREPRCGDGASGGQINHIYVD